MTDLPAIQQEQQLVIAAGAADQNPAVVYLASLARGSRPAMQRALNVIAELLTGQEGVSYVGIPWGRLRFQHTAALRAALAEKYSYSTANKTLSALRGVLRAAWKLGQMSAEEYQQAASVENLKGETMPAGRAIGAGELGALLNTCGNDALGIRDAAIISLLYATGMRRAELVELDMADYDPAVRGLILRGKRNKERTAYVDDGAAAALDDWLAARGDMPGPLFRGVGNRNQGGRLTTQAIYKMLQTRAAAAGVAELSPHDFRRTFVGELLDRGADIVTVQKMAGHANVNTTARYDRRGEQAKQRAARLLHVPHKRRVLAGE
jgi:site-specific recombinase XerD